MAKEIKLFGLTFKPMDEDDYIGLAGAAEGSYVCYGEDDIHIYTPSNEPYDNGSTITTISNDGLETTWTAVTR